MKRFIVIFVIFAGFIAPANSQVKKVAQTGLQFLKVDVSPRAAAMGGAYTLAGYDATAMFSNPAGIALGDAGLDVFAGSISWIADISFNAFGLTKDLGKWGTVGVSFMNSDYGEIIGTRVDPGEEGFVETGQVEVGEYAAGLTYARRLTDKFAIGIQGKQAYQHLGENLFPDTTTVQNEVTGWAFDFGTVFYPGFKSFRFGMSIRNFSEDFIYQEESFSLPLTFRLGIAMDVLDLFGDHSNSLLVAIDAVDPRDYTERINIGAEYMFRDMLAFRLGYKYNYDLEGLTAGLGANLNVGTRSIRIDYAFSDMGIFGMTNRVAVGFSL